MYARQSSSLSRVNERPYINIYIYRGQINILSTSCVHLIALAAAPNTTFASYMMKRSSILTVITTRHALIRVNKNRVFIDRIDFAYKAPMTG